MKRSNWSLVMVSYVASDEHYEYNGEDYYYYEGEESYYDEEEYYYDEYNAKDNDTIVIHKFPFHVGTSKATAYTCGVFVCVCVCSMYLCTCSVFESTRVLHTTAM